MADQTFTSGQILTASQMTTLQANSGLTFIKSQTIGSAVSSVDVTSVFSSTFDNYKIIVSGGTSTSFSPLAIRFGAAASGYKYSLVYAAYAGAVANASSAAAASIVYIGSGASTGIMANIDVSSPNLATLTVVSAPYFDATNAGHTSGYLNNSTQYTGFSIDISGGTMTGGNISVYGYRK